MFEVGFNVCIGSSGATHIGILSCAACVHIMYKGFKLNVPSRTYNIAVDNTCRIIGSTTGNPPIWNAMTLIFFDGLLCNERDDIIPEDFVFKLLE